MSARARGLLDLAHALRAGGAKVGSSGVLDANAALTAVGPGRRADVRAALRVTLIRNPEDLALYDLLFDSFFPDGSSVAKGGDSLNLPPSAGPAPPALRRRSDALAGREDAAVIEAARRLDEDAAGTESGAERLRSRDFEQMSAAELALAKRAIALLAASQARRRSRRSTAGGASRRLDLRRMLQRRELHKPLYRTPLQTPRDSVLLIDISGSMTVYSRLFLHLAHALSRCPGRTESFVFATRLSRITRSLRSADPDAAIAAASRAAPDWDGGTRLGACLAQFNRQWSRRVLARGARVILLTDGLERDAVELLEVEAARLARAAHELIWINPLLRSAAYAPLAAGARVLIRHADAVRPAHNLASLAELARLLG